MILEKRLENAEIYDLGDGKKRLLIGGDIDNTLPFDGNSLEYVPQRYKFADAMLIAPDTYRLTTGRFGYTVNVATGEIRVHPVRGEWGCYYSIAPQIPTPLSYRQVHDRLLELFVNTTQVRYSFFIGKGFKINIRLKDSYTGGDTFEHTFKVGMVGLIRQGRKVLYQGKEVGVLPNPFMTDSSGSDETYYVQESLGSGKVTLAATGINSLVLPVDIDPTLNIQPADIDSKISAFAKDSVFGSNVKLSLVFVNGFQFYNLFQYDFSATTMLSITNATLSAYFFEIAAGNPVGKTMFMDRNKRTDWVDSEATYRIYKSGSPWQVEGALGANDRDTANRVSTTVPALNNWMTWNILAHAQDALASRGSILNLITFNNTDAVNNQGNLHSSDYVGDLLLRPKISIDYTVATVGAFNRSRLVNKGLTGPQNRSTLANA